MLALEWIAERKIEEAVSRGEIFTELRNRK